MRLILLDSPDEARGRFYPLALSRPLWQLRCGITSLGEKLIARIGASNVAYFVPDYMADSYRSKVDGPVNDLSVLSGDDILIVDPRIKAGDFSVSKSGPSEVGLDDEGNVQIGRDHLETHCIARSLAPEESLPGQDLMDDRERG